MRAHHHQHPPPSIPFFSGASHVAPGPPPRPLRRQDPPAGLGRSARKLRRCHRPLSGWPPRGGGRLPRPEAGGGGAAPRAGKSRGAAAASATAPGPARRRAAAVGRWRGGGFPADPRFARQVPRSTARSWAREGGEGRRGAASSVTVCECFKLKGV